MENPILPILKLFIMMICLSLVSCQNWTDEKLVATVSKTCKYNIIGITGPESTEPYVEVRYCKDDGHGNNVIVKEMLCPPILFGGHPVNISCDSIIEITGHGHKDSKYKATGNYKILLKHQYGEGEAEYLHIINHSIDKSIEFFVAGSQDMKIKGNGCNGWGVIDIMPTVYYRHAPIYYLLFPQKKYAQNLLGSSLDCNDVFNFEGNRCGDLELNQGWSVDEVMGLYRAEYNNDPEIELYIDTHFDDLGRLNKALHSGNPYVKYKRFYGVIGPGETLTGGSDIPLLATSSLWGDEL